MAKKSRTRRVYVRRKGVRHSGGFKLPVAVVAGFLPLAYDAYNGGKATGVNGVFEAVTRDLTGYDIPGKVWNFGDMVKGWVPIVAGFVAHKIAGSFGINRALARAHVPLFRV